MVAKLPVLKRKMRYSNYDELMALTHIFQAGVHITELSYAVTDSVAKIVACWW